MEARREREGHAHAAKYEDMHATSGVRMGRGWWRVVASNRKLGHCRDRGCWPSRARAARRNAAQVPFGSRPGYGCSMATGRPTGRVGRPAFVGGHRLHAF